MTTETRQRLLDALDSCRLIQRYTAGIDFEFYQRDDQKRDAVERRLGIIGEALHRGEGHSGIGAGWVSAYPAPVSPPSGPNSSQTSGSVKMPNSSSPSKTPSPSLSAASGSVP